MQNYFNYFTEIEEVCSGAVRCRCCHLDWALIEIWREANIPLKRFYAASTTHLMHDARCCAPQQSAQGKRPACVHSVMEAVEQAVEASTGAATAAGAEAVESGFETERIGHYLELNAGVIETAKLVPPADAIAAEVAVRLRALAVSLHAEPTQSLEELDRTLSVLEEKMFAALLTSAPEEELVKLREQASKELAPYRSKMQAVQIKQVQQQFLQRDCSRHKLPRLSLFT
jgi:hypothetical protein